MQALGAAGALAARVTGSGPTVFGVFPKGAAPKIDGTIRAEIE
jgi:4-diphosphocytidyl-2C-methyl-D-erythritol kinase